jgi:hypothetical protein
MTDNEDDTSEELGKTGEKMGGIANRFGASTDTSKTAGTGETTDGNSTSSSEMTETTESTTTTETNETIKTSETIEAVGPDDEGFVLREDWNGRTIYLSDDDINEIDMRYSEVNVKWQREYGEQLPKNERYYPAVIRAGLNGTSIEEELGFEE